jgi:hypothetical protein
MAIGRTAPKLVGLIPVVIAAAPGLARADFVTIPNP